MNDDQPVVPDSSSAGDSNDNSTDVPNAEPIPVPMATFAEDDTAIESDSPFVNIDPRSITVGRIVGLITAIVLSALVVPAVFLVWLKFGIGIPFWIALSGGLLGIICLFLLFYIWPAWSYRCTTYRLNETGLEIHHGVFWKHRTSVPVARVQHADVSQGPLQRKFELGKLTVHTAGTQNASVELDGVAHDVAVALRNRIISQRKTSDVV